MQFVDRDPELLLRPTHLRCGDAHEILGREGVIERLFRLERDLKALVHDARFGGILRCMRRTRIRKSAKAIE